MRLRLALSSLYDGNEDPDQLVGFRKEFPDLRGIEGSRLRQEFKPISGLIKFLEGALDLADEFGIRPRTARLAIMCSYRRRTPQKLPPHYVGMRPLRESNE